MMERKEFNNSLADYQSMSQMLKEHSRQEIIETVAAITGLSTEQVENYPMGGYSKGMTSGAYRFTLQDLTEHVDQYDWLYSRLEDKKSRYVFTNLVGYRIFPANSFLKAAYDEKIPQYFDKSIISCDENEVFVDCGGFTGDTVESFIREFKHYKQIYTYEPEEKNVRACCRNLAKYHNVTVRNCGVGEMQNCLSIEGSGSSSTFMKQQNLSASGGVQIISLDEDIPEKITFLKMDIEGFEIPALLGAKRHIRDDFPKLAICTYHIVSDMWEIPKLIDSIHPGYRFFIRNYDFPQNWETVLYAIPPEKVVSPPDIRVVRKAKRVITMPFCEGWENAQLIKDCGVIPFLLHKNHGCDVSMIGARVSETYSNMKYVEGMKLEFLPDGSLQTKIDYLTENAKQIDCMLLHGPYEPYFPIAECYKMLNPEGKISLALDANSSWMDRIQWTKPEFRAFMNRCDVTSASGHTMQRHLNEKWPWPIEFIPNGFYNFTKQEWPFSYDQKKNVILTVGRLGTPQKATHVLLESFARMAGAVPEWELRLAGSVAPEFEVYLQQFREKHPDLIGRIHFLGNVPDRSRLYQEYSQAKIFALPSTFEGGTPNVIAEALTMGDAVAITKIDEYQDAIDNGRCGMASEIGDIEGFSSVLLELCTSDNLEQLCHRAYSYAHDVYDMRKVVARLYYLIFGGRSEHEQSGGY